MIYDNPLLWKRQKKHPRKKAENAIERDRKSIQERKLKTQLKETEKPSKKTFPKRNLNERYNYWLFIVVRKSQGLLATVLQVWGFLRNHFGEYFLLRSDHELYDLIHIWVRHIKGCLFWSSSWLTMYEKKMKWFSNDFFFFI